MIRIWAIHFFDEKESLYGDATAIIQYGTNGSIEHCVLIDTATSSATTVKKLKNAGIKTIDAVVISHAHGDHYGGLTKVFENFKVKALYLPDCTQLDKYQKSYGNAIRNQASKAKKYGASYTYMKAGSSFTVGKIKCDCIWQASASALSEHDDHHFVNNESIVTRFTLEGIWAYHSAGDLQNEGNNLLIKAVKNLKADIFKCQWHGDANACNEAICKAIKPVVAFSNYHHKEQSGRGTTRKRLEAVGALVMRNAENGDVYFDCEGNKMTVHASKNFTSKTFTKNTKGASTVDKSTSAAASTTLNGIDISNHQGKANMDLASVLDKTKTDFVIVKATEGTTFVDAYCDKFYQIAKKKGKGLGFYHFARPENNTAKAEAKFFYENTKNYFGEAIPILDWESSGKANVAWAKEWLDEVYRLTGVRPIIYMSESVVNAYNWKSVADANYGLWVAKYRDYGVDSNYDMSNAGTEPSVKYWKFYAMWQWTSSGRLTGYSKNLDCNIFYGSREAWNKYAGITSAVKPAEPVEPVKSVEYVNLTGKYPVVKNGSTGNAVKLVQVVTGATVDGKFGDKTEAAVKAFQKKYSLTVDGLVGEKTWTKILAWLATV